MTFRRIDVLTMKQKKNTKTNTLERRANMKDVLFLFC